MLRIYRPLPDNVLSTVVQCVLRLAKQGTRVALVADDSIRADLDDRLWRGWAFLPHGFHTRDPIYFGEDDTEGRSVVMVGGDIAFCRKYLSRDVYWVGTDVVDPPVDGKEMRFFVQLSTGKWKPLSTYEDYAIT